MQGIQREECDNCGKRLAGVADSQITCPVCKSPHTFSEPEEPAEADDEPAEEEPSAPGPNDRVVVRRK